MTPPTLPPGQIETKRFPVVGERSPSGELDDPRHWTLTVDGLVERPLCLTFEEFMSLNHRDLTFDVHCVTT